MTEPMSISLEFPLKYRLAEGRQPYGMKFNITDKDGWIVAATNDEAIAKVLTHFPNKFIELMGTTENTQRGPLP
ncbi:MAG: hypothetical protein WCA35_22790 [Kovacikia sp.]